MSHVLGGRQVRAEPGPTLGPAPRSYLTPLRLDFERFVGFGREVVVDAK
jgi:hypothetical protein